MSPGMKIRKGKYTSLGEGLTLNDKFSGSLLLKTGQHVFNSLRT